MIRRAIGTVLIATLLVWPVAAQSPLTITSQVETGWTSNATDSAAGRSDFYATHNEEISLTGTAGDALLRGTLRITQTRFLDTTYEDDDEVAGGVEAELALGTDAKLRLGYAVTRSWTGDDLNIEGFIIPIRSEETDHEFVGTFVVTGPDQKVTVDVAALWAVQGKSELVGLGLPPLKLEADVGTVTTRIAWEKAISPTMAALAGMEAWFTTVPELDQLLYFRAPADGGRVSTGLRVIAGQLTLSGSAGFDLVWPKGHADLRRTSPYFAVAASLVPTDGLTVTLNTATGVELADPLDGVAGRTAAIDLGATVALAPQVELSAQLGGWQEAGLYDTSLIRSRRTAAVGLHYAVSPRLGYGATVSFAHHDDPGESYDKTGVALSVTGSL
ncbi:MAG: hypothetical protein JWP26_423 [Devosia sp.]|uniref:hypothetical protein n=1 Tax=Devosia sp. TaxID=1871048 RepID=UPI0026133120|nr:hypothetical protein [Devosia sp.]MDB5585453.1 hypothetical protein [Devosia sp.]